MTLSAVSCRAGMLQCGRALRCITAKQWNVPPLSTKPDRGDGDVSSLYLFAISQVKASKP